VYPRVPRQLIRSTETLRATRELAGMRLFSSVRSDVACLVF
jgi:hypothetical protein